MLHTKRRRPSVQAGWYTDEGPSCLQGADAMDALSLSSLYRLYQYICTEIAAIMFLDYLLLLSSLLVLALNTFHAATLQPFLSCSSFSSS